VEVRTDLLGPQAGVWLRATPRLVEMLVNKSASLTDEPEGRGKVLGILAGSSERITEVEPEAA